MDGSTERSTELTPKSRRRQIYLSVACKDQCPHRLIICLILIFYETVNIIDKTH